MGRAWGSTQARHLEGLTRLGFCKLAPNLQARHITAHDLLVHHEIPAYTNFFPIYRQNRYEKFFLSPKKYVHIIRKVEEALEFSYVLQFFKEDSSTIRVFGICILSLYA